MPRRCWRSQFSTEIAVTKLTIKSSWPNERSSSHLQLQKDVAFLPLITSTSTTNIGFHLKIYTFLEVIMLQPTNLSQHSVSKFGIACRTVSKKRPAKLHSKLLKSICILPFFMWEYAGVSNKKYALPNQR